MWLTIIRRACVLLQRAFVGKRFGITCGPVKLSEELAKYWEEVHFIIKGSQLFGRGWYYLAGVKNIESFMLLKGRVKIDAILLKGRVLLEWWNHSLPKNWFSLGSMCWYKAWLSLKWSNSLIRVIIIQWIVLLSKELSLDYSIQLTKRSIIWSCFELWLVVGWFIHYWLDDLGTILRFVQ